MLVLALLPSLLGTFLSQSTCIVVLTLLSYFNGRKHCFCHCCCQHCRHACCHQIDLAVTSDNIFCRRCHILVLRHECFHLIRRIVTQQFITLSRPGPFFCTRPRKAKVKSLGELNWKPTGVSSVKSKDQGSVVYGKSLFVVKWYCLFEPICKLICVASTIQRFSPRMRIMNRNNTNVGSHV